MKVRLIVAVLAVMPICPVWAQQAPTYDARPKITVSGEAVVNVKPDKIVISLGIETKDNDIMVAKQKNNDILKKAVAAVKECGVAEKDIQTDHLSIQPRWKIEYQHEEFLGYVVRNAFTVTLTDTAKVEELVTTVLLAGVNYIHGIDFQTTELKKYREQARELALKAAKEKAKKMVAALGPHEIGAPIQINENYGGSPWSYYSNWSGGAWGFSRSQGMSQNAFQNVGSGSGEISDTIALGKISVHANVNVTFELKK